MSERTLKLLMAALGEELEAQKLKPTVRIADDQPLHIGEWCRRDEAKEVFGIPPHRLKQLVRDRKVKAKKFDQDEATSVVVFKTADIRKAIEEMPDYLYETPTTETKGK